MVTRTKINNKSVSIVFFVLEEQALFCAVAINSIIINTKLLKNIYVFIENENTRRKVLSNIIYKNENKIKYIIVNNENNLSISNKILLQRDSYKLRTILKHIKERWVLLLDVGILLQDNIFNVLEEITFNNPIYGIRGEQLNKYVSIDLLNLLGINAKDRGIDTRFLLINLDFCRIQNILKHIETLLSTHYIDDGNGKIFNIIYYNKLGLFKSDSVYIYKHGVKENISNIRKTSVILFSISELNKRNSISQLWNRYKKMKANNIRIQTDSLLGLKFDDLIVTTYFISKSNPQAGSLSHANDPNSLVQEYKKNDDKLTSVLFNSVKKHNQTLVVFHDGLDKKYIKQNSCQNILFIDVKLGPYSTNDERFFVYNEFIQQVKFERIFFIDCFDVEIRKPPFGIFDKYGERIFVGRDSCNSIINCPYVLDKLQHVLSATFELDHHQDFEYFINMPLYNAGIIGGAKRSVNILLNFICNILEAANSNKNVNMAVVNYAIYRLFLRDYKYIAPKAPDVNPLNDLRSCNDEIFSGYPINSSFKKYEDRNDVYFIHK